MTLQKLWRFCEATVLMFALAFWLCQMAGFGAAGHVAALTLALLVLLMADEFDCL